MTPVTTANSAAPPSANQNAEPLASLTSNFSDFLNLLMTQLTHQNPVSPLDANAFTNAFADSPTVSQILSDRLAAAGTLRQVLEVLVLLC